MTARSARRSLRGSSEVRIRWALILLAMVLSLFGARLIQLQGLDPRAYAARADAEGLVTAVLPAERGQILDRNGQALARTVAGVMVIADPVVTRPHAAAIAKILAHDLGIDYFDTLATLRRSTNAKGRDIRFAYIARHVPTTKVTRTLQTLKEAALAGIDTMPDPVRDYPAGDVAANLVGFAPVPDAADSGAGLERAFDSLLAGKDGHETYEVGAGNRIPLGENTAVQPVNGHDLTLTIDRDVQWQAQRVLRTAVESVDAESGAAIAMDTRTGEILALADYPTFDANDPARARKDDRGSRALSNVYEPGSVAKVLTAASLIDAGLVTPRTRITVPAQLSLPGKDIKDYFDHGKIRLTLAGVIAKSSNIGTALAAQQMRHEQLWKYLTDFGLGERTGVGIAGETRGILPPGSTWTDLTQATISFGQGVSVNALQMATAVNAIANGGELVTPSLIKGEAQPVSGGPVGTDTVTRRQVVSPQAAAATARMMEMVTAEGGTAPKAAIPGYRVAGKTGTAQQVGEGRRGYDGSIAVSFAGFAPADAPRFTVYVVISKPKRAAGGGSTAGPVFRKIMTNLLQKYYVPPTGTPAADLPIEW